MICSSTIATIVGNYFFHLLSENFSFFFFLLSVLYEKKKQTTNKNENQISVSALQAIAQSRDGAIVV